MPCWPKGSKFFLQFKSKRRMMELTQSEKDYQNFIPEIMISLPLWTVSSLPSQLLAGDVRQPEASCHGCWQTYQPVNEWLQGSASVAGRLNVDPSVQTSTFLTRVAMRKSDLGGEAQAFKESDVVLCVPVCCLALWRDWKCWHLHSAGALWALSSWHEKCVGVC